MNDPNFFDLRTIVDTIQQHEQRLSQMEHAGFVPDENADLSRMLKGYQKGIIKVTTAYYRTFGAFYALSGFSLIIIGSPFFHDFFSQWVWGILYASSGIASIASIFYENLRFRVSVGAYMIGISLLTCLATSIVMLPLHSVKELFSWMFGIIFWASITLVHLGYTSSIPDMIEGMKFFRKISDASEQAGKE